MATSDNKQQQCMQRSPFSYRNNRLLRRQASTTSRNPFIAGVDASDLWLSPPQASIDGGGPEEGASRATSLPAKTQREDARDFSLLGGGDLVSSSDFLLPSYSYSSPPSPGRGNSNPSSSNLASSAALFPSIDSWIHSNQGLGIEEQEQDSQQPIASTSSYDPLPFYSPPSSAGDLASPSSSSSSASSTSPQLLVENGNHKEQHQQQRTTATTSKKKRRKSSSLSNMANNNSNNPAIVTTESGAFNVNSKSGMKDACSYDLRDHQEPATVQKEYGGSASENKDLNGLQTKVENASGPVCFPKTASTPVPTSPSRFANPQDVKPHIGADPASSSVAAATNGSSDMSSKPLSSSSANSHSSNNNNNNIALDPSLGLSTDSSQHNRPTARAGQPSFLKNTGDGMIRTPGPNQLLSPKAAFNDYDDILKRSTNGGNNGRQSSSMQQGSPRQQQMQIQPSSNQQQHGSPMQQQHQQFKLPPQPQQRGDIQVPQMNLPQMPPPQQPMQQQQQQQNSFQAQPQQPPPPGQYGDATEAQLLAALGGQRSLSHQGSPQQNRGGQSLPNQQQQQQQRGMHQQMGGSNQGSPQQRQLQTQPAPQPMTVQQQNAARQAAYQGFMAHPPPTGANNASSSSSSTDIQVPQSNTSLATSNVGTPSAGQSSLPPLPNYQSAPAPLAFNDGSFFSHQAILASLQAEENAKAAAAAAAVMGFQNGNWTGGNGQQQGQGQNGNNNYGNFNAQPGQQQQAGGLPPFAAPGGTSVLGDFSFEQHFGPPPPAGNSPDASTSSRKRIKGGKSGSRGSLSRSNSTTSNNGTGRNKAMAAEARALQGGQYGGAFNFGAYGSNNNNVGVPAMGGINDLLDAEGEEDDDSKPQFNSRGMPKRKSASAARELAQAQQKDHTEEYEYQGFVPKGSGIAGGLVAGGALPPSANLGAGGAPGGDDSDDSDDDDDGDEWVAEESDDSYGRKKKGGNKRGRKSGAKASLTPAEAEALRAASPTTAAAALASVNANGTFDFSGLLGDYSVGSPDSSSGTPGPSKKRKSNAAPPGSGNISCDYVDPKTGERCPVKFRRPYDQARHMETVHSGQADKTKWACITCKKSFSRKDALIRHGRISSHPTM